MPRFNLCDFIRCIVLVTNGMVQVCLTASTCKCLRFSRIEEIQIGCGGGLEYSIYTILFYNLLKNLMFNTLSKQCLFLSSFTLFLQSDMKLRF